MSSLNTLLQFFRDHSRTQREKGTYFEDLSKLYFQHDAIQQQESVAHVSTATNEIVAGLPALNEITEES